MLIAISLFTDIEGALFSMFGSMQFVAFAIMIFFILAFLLMGIEFRYAVLIIAPLIVGFGAMGWVDKWLVIMAWIMIITFAGSIVWNIIRER